MPSTTGTNLHRDYIFRAPWEDVTTAFWQKYPSPLQPHVIRVDTLERWIDPQNQTYHSVRLLSLKYALPSWTQILCRGSTISGFALEESTCNLCTKTLTLKSRNVTLANLVTVQETCEYRPCPSAPHAATLYTQKSSIHVTGLGYLSSAFERFISNTSEVKAQRGREVIQKKIDQFHKRQSLDTFPPPHKK